MRGCSSGAQPVDDQPRLLGGRDDLELDADLLAHPGEKRVAIGRPPARLGRDVAAGGDVALADLAGADPAAPRSCAPSPPRTARRSRPAPRRAGRCAKTRRRRESRRRRGARPAAAIVGAEIERGELACKRTLVARRRGFTKVRRAEPFRPPRATPSVLKFPLPNALSTASLSSQSSSPVMLTRQADDKSKPRNRQARPYTTLTRYGIGGYTPGHPQGAPRLSRMGDRLTVGQRTLTPPV